jgi:hypothetical protein
MFKAKTMSILHALKKQFPTTRIPDLALIVAVGSLSITWFRGDFLINRGDFDLSLDRIRGLTRSLYQWDDNISLGTPNSRITAAIPYNFFFALSEIIGIPLVIAEKILFYICFTSSGLTMYYLTSTLVKRKRIASLLSALFYMMNMYSLIFIWNFNYGISYVFMYSFFPLILALYIRGLEEQKGLRYAIQMCIIWILTNSAAYASPPFFILSWIILISYWLFYTIFHRKEKTKIGHALRFTTLLVLIWIFLSMYWIAPMSFSVHSEFAKASVHGIKLSDIDIFRLNSAPLHEALRLAGYWGLYDGYKGDPYYPWASPYASIPFILISFLMPFLAFLPLIFLLKNKYVLYFTSLALIGLFLVKGSYPPLEDINLQLFSNPVLLRIFRAPIIKFGLIVVLAYAFLIGVGANELYNYLQRFNFKHKAIISKISLFIIMFMLLGVYAWPFWTGDLIYAGGKISASSRIRVPSYYYNASDYLGRQDEIFRILPLPFPTLYSVEYSWDHGYSGTDPSHWLFPKPTVSIFTGDAGYETAAYVVKLFHEDPTFDVGKTFALLNIKYVLLHRDTNWNYIEGLPWWISTSLEAYQFILSSQKSLFLEKSFGKLDFYRNENWRPLHIYATSNALLVNGGLDEMIQSIQRDDFIPGQSVLLLSDQLETQQIAALPPNTLLFSNSTNNVSVTYEKINPTKYVVHINASEPFFLVFSESYHKDWVAYVDGQQVPNEYHFMANGYANSWYINKTGSYIITLEFWPQKLFYIGATISITSLILCILYISKNKMKTIYKKYIKKTKLKMAKNHSDSNTHKWANTQPS